MALDVNDERAPYLQVAEAIRSAIIKGEHLPGERLPTVGDLVTTYGVARMTVQRAINTLRGEGYVVSWQGRGTFVRSATPTDTTNERAESDEAIMRRLDAIADQMERLEDRMTRLEKRRTRQRDG